jgi:bisphosphoglycerate-dependent phosphoglycerate mutase family 1
VTQRLLPYWYDAIVPDLHTGACVLVVSHGNTLRALIKHLDGLSDEQVAELNIPTGMPLAYDLRPDMQPLGRGGRYLGSQGPGGPASDATGTARRQRWRPAAPLIRTHDGTGVGNARL